MSPYHYRFVTSRLFKNISRDIVLVAELQGHALRVESGVFQGLTGVLQDMTLGFPFLPNPVFLFVVQLLIHLCFDGRILRSPMLQQSPRHRLEDMKERDGHLRGSAQKRSNILNSAMRVFGLVDGKKNSHSVLLRKQRRWNRAVIYIMPHEFSDSRATGSVRIEREDEGIHWEMCRRVGKSPKLSTRREHHGRRRIPPLKRGDPQSG